MHMIYKLKFIIGIFLLICTCLPLGSCQKKQVNAINVIENKTYDNELSVSEQSNPDYLIPVTQIDKDDPNSWVLFIAFIWPLPVLIAVRRICKSSAKKRIANIIEMCLSIFSAYIIYSFVFTIFYTPMIFGYMAFALMNIYILLNLVEIIKSFARLNKI